MKRDRKSLNQIVTNIYMDLLAAAAIAEESKDDFDLNHLNLDPVMVIWFLENIAACQSTSQEIHEKSLAVANLVRASDGELKNRKLLLDIRECALGYDMFQHVTGAGI